MDPTSHPAAAIAAVLAVKRLDDAKTRLAATSTTGTPHRSLVLSMLLDTMAAVSRAGVDHIVVISPDVAVRSAATGAGALAVDEEFVAAEGPHGRLNAAFTQASATAREQWPSIRTILLVQADLPAATPESVRQVIAATAPHRQALVTDREGRGTTVLARSADIVDAPRFGPESAAAHRMAGAVDLDPDGLRWPDLRTDVDTMADLVAATRLGLGAHTAAALADTPQPHACKSP